MSGTRRGLLGLIIAASLSACASPVPKVYTLVAVPGAAFGGRPVTALVAAVDIAKYLDRPQIVTRSGTLELGLSADRKS